MIDSLLDEVTPQIAKDASALVSVAAWADSPAGVVVLPFTEQAGGCSGFSIGTGHALAAAHDCPRGAIAVAVNIGEIIKSELDVNPADSRQAIANAKAFCEAVSCHEVAHALVGPQEPPDLAAMVKELARKPSGPASPLETARTHGPRWAAADCIIQARACRLRPASQRRFWDWYLQAELAIYGFDYETMLGVVGDHGDDVEIRRLLSADSPLAVRLATSCPPVEARAEILEQRLRNVPSAVDFGRFDERGSHGQHC
jgi:hypothetical protein